MMTSLFLRPYIGISRYLHVTISNDMRVFFSDANPQLQALEALENTYVKNEGAFFIVAPKDGNVFTRETLAAVEELTEAAWQMPYSSRVDTDRPSMVFLMVPSSGCDDL
jgi:predicted RND superfamily exporter protein